ncbi:glycosyltransferase family 2 protein [Aestuariivivens sediminicola]|uniref:glycosyltransferase family 2 protein n=1 Tax=Aestuariivivens sediminicola TaxID=2913560 RepID=UPI001F5729AE|nr:glycosyltransferase family A protein [Aestuariivivens sediminicola]
MPDKTPMVSVIVPCYNQSEYLDDALESVYNQSYKNWECIIVNDGSTDDTRSKGTSWIKKDARFIYIEQDNMGVSGARNKGIGVSKGIYILPLDADDKIDISYIYHGVSAFLKNNNLKLVYCRAMKFGMVSEVWNLRPFSYYNLAVSNIIFSSAIFKREDWERVGGYDLRMDQGLEDWEFWIHILKSGGEVRQLEMTGFYYRIHKESRNQSLSSVNKKELKEYMSVKHADFFVRQFGSFHAFMHEGLEENKNLKRQLKSRKHAFGVLLKSYFNLFKKKEH